MLLPGRSFSSIVNELLHDKQIGFAARITRSIPVIVNEASQYMLDINLTFKKTSLSETLPEPANVEGKLEHQVQSLFRKSDVLVYDVEYPIQQFQFGDDIYELSVSVENPDNQHNWKPYLGND